MNKTLYKMLHEFNLLLLAGILYQSMHIMDDGFSYAALGVFVSGLLLVIAMLYLRNGNFDEKKWRRK